MPYGQGLEYIVYHMTLPLSINGGGICCQKRYGNAYEGVDWVSLVSDDSPDRESWENHPRDLDSGNMEPEGVFPDDLHPVLRPGVAVSS